MRIAVLNDVHGNMFALQKVLHKIQEQGVDRTIFLGDVSFLGLYPQECFDLIQNLNPIVNIKGNTDANIEDLDQFRPSNQIEEQLLEMCLYMDKKMNSSSKQLLQNLPIFKRETFEGADCILCHGSPYSYKDQLTESRKDEFCQRILAEKVQAVVCAHTHQPQSFTIGEAIIQNFGAIGYSFDGDTRAHYGIIDVSNRDSIVFESYLAEYDIERYKSEVRAQNPPFKELLLYALENGKPKRW